MRLTHFALDSPAFVKHPAFWVRNAIRNLTLAGFECFRLASWKHFATTNRRARMRFSNVSQLFYPFFPLTHITWRSALAGGSTCCFSNTFGIIV
ncbi:hypothetical protein CDAR_434731 [Caerostris darwini]|uniref:Uncharacterized protein n=1 Tax=Caerostris darwini TaxID=1538125 RepID=A0AAV4STS3_9ARAC|nr:hypothetical protein CDAR_434731 [Caerostris darwini]